MDITLFLMASAVTILPGFAILISAFSDLLIKRSLISVLLTSVGLSLTYIAIVGYALDLTIGVSFSSFSIVTSLFLFCILVWRRKNISQAMRYMKENFVLACNNIKLVDAFTATILVFSSVLIMWAPFAQVFIFPSDPVIWLFRGRQIAVNEHWALLVREGSGGQIMTAGFGFYYWLGILFSFNLDQAYAVIRFAGPFFGMLSLLSVYELVKEMTRSKLAGSFSMLCMGTWYLWVWAQRLTAEYTAIGFMIPFCYLLMFNYLRNQGRSNLLLLSVTVGGLWLYHPPSALIVIVPILLWYMLKGRKFIPWQSALEAILVFFATTGVYWSLLNVGSFKPRLYSGSIQQLSLFSQEYLSIANIFTPFQQESGFVPLLFFLIAVIWYLRQRSKKEGSFSSSKMLFEILLISFFLMYGYWVLPSPYLRAFLGNTYDVSRMPLHLSVPVSVLAGLGFSASLSIRNKLNSFKELRFSFRRKETRINISKWRKRFFTTCLILLFATSFFLQFNWGYSKFYDYKQFYPGSMTNDGARMVIWVEKNTPSNSTILIDDTTAPSSIETRGIGWLALSALYPRNVLGNSDIFQEAEISMAESFIDFCHKNNVNYVIITNPSKYPLLTLALNENLIHKEGDILLFFLPTAPKSYTGPVVKVSYVNDSKIEYKPTEGSYIIPTDASFQLTLTGYTDYEISEYPAYFVFNGLTVNGVSHMWANGTDANFMIIVDNVKENDTVIVMWKANLLFQDIGWKDYSFMKDWSKGGPSISSNGSTAQLTYKNDNNSTVWASTDKLISPSLNTSENVYQFFIIRLFVVEQMKGDYLAVYMRDTDKGDQLMGVFEDLPTGQWLTYLIDLQNGYNGNRVLNIDQISIVLRTGAGNTYIIKLDYAMFCKQTLLQG